MAGRLIAAGYALSARLGLLAAWFAGLIMVGMTALILTEIVMRSFFARSTHLVEEYVGYGLMTMVFLGLAHTFENGSLIRVDLLLEGLGTRIRRLVEIAICGATLFVTVFASQYLWVSMARHYAQNTVSTSAAATPIWIPEFMVFAGLLLFGIQVVLYLLRLCLGGSLINETKAFD